jgi:hypothetical protein
MRFRRRSEPDVTPPGVQGPPPTLPFPEFRYHPDPRGTGVVVESDARCLRCGWERGYLYTGPVYATAKLDDALCPWCIADGSAAERFDAEFTDVGWAVPDDVPQEVTDEIARRTPGFFGWQQEHWLYHCGDGAAFLGRVGYQELQGHPDALESLRHEHDELSWSASEVEEYLQGLDRDGGATAYLFRCRHCRRHFAYSDFE